MGLWASQEYLVRCQAKVRVELDRYQLNPTIDQLHCKELEWLNKLLDEAAPLSVNLNSIGPLDLSDKFLKLVSLLQQEMTAASAAIVFVETKAMVHFLRKLLESRPETKGILRCVARDTYHTDYRMASRSSQTCHGQPRGF